VAICIPTYNQSHYLARSIASAFAQDYASIEVWVSDDASTDGTAAELERIARVYPDLRYFRQPVNLRISGNNNSLLAKPETDFIVRLDSDDILEPSYVRSLLPLMLEHKNAGYGHAAIQLIDKCDRPISIARVARGTGYRTADDALREAVGAYRVAANVIMFRADALRRLNYYRDLDYGEDYDLAVRMADAGYGNVYCDKVLARYRVWSDVGGVRVKRKATQLRGYVRLFEESLQPAFERRGWDVEPLRRKRQSLALRHAPACFEPQFDGRDRRELSALILKLSGENNFRLQCRLFALAIGLRPLFDLQRGVDSKLRSFVKTMLSRLRDVSGSLR